VSRPTARAAPHWAGEAAFINRRDAKSAEIAASGFLRLVRVFRGPMVGGNSVGGFGGLPKPSGQRPVLPMRIRPSEAAVNGPTAHAALR